MNTDKTTAVSQKRLREFARRALRVVERHKDRNVEIATVGRALVPAAEAYIKIYDESVKYRALQDVGMAVGLDSIAALERLSRRCLAVAQHVLHEVDTRGLSASTEVPDRLIASARKLIELLTHAGEKVPNGAQFLEPLKAAVETAERDWAQAQASRVDLQGYQGVIREHALTFNRALVALRRILRATLGTRHLDYQTLRVARTSSAEEEETVLEEPITATTNGASNDARASVVNL